MKTMKILAAIAVCVFFANSNGYTQDNGGVVAFTMSSAGQMKPDSIFSKIYQKLAQKYKFLFAPSKDIVQDDQNTRLLLGRLISDHSTMQDGQVVLTLTVKDLRQAKFPNCNPNELLYIIREKMNQRNESIMEFFTVEQRQDMTADFNRRRAERLNQK